LITDSGAFDACFHGESVDEETDEERVEAVERDWSHGGLLLKCCPDPTVLVRPGVALENRNRRAKTVRCRPLLKHSTPHRTFVGAPVRFRQEVQTPLVPVTGAGEAGPTTSAVRRRRPGAADSP